MNFAKPYGNLIIIFILVFTLALSLMFEVIPNAKHSGLEEEAMQGFDKQKNVPVPFATDPSNKRIINGYYQVTDTKMTEIPYGFEIDPLDPKKIIPTTRVGINALKPKYNAPLPKEGEKMPDNFYLTKYCSTSSSSVGTSSQQNTNGISPVLPSLNPQASFARATSSSLKSLSFTPSPTECSMFDMSLAVLPPNMSPNLVKIDISGNPAKILYTYEPGYISDTQYYENKYATPNNLKSILDAKQKDTSLTPENFIRMSLSSLPSELYYTDISRNFVSFLRYDQIADASKGYGKITNPNPRLRDNKLKYQESEYKNNIGDREVQFHDDEETIKKQNNIYDLDFGEVRVKDQNGNIVVLPKTKAQDNVTYYEPGEFKFGASTYVPNYEDSVYLSSIGSRTILGEVKPSNCDKTCKAYNEFKYKMDKHCAKN